MNTCVCCGSAIPEGIQYCYRCAKFDRINYKKSK